MTKKKRMTELTLTPSGETSILGNIYIGRVENIVENIRAAFVKISPEQTCYFSFEDLEHALFTKKQSAKKALCIGDELVVQVEREALKTKEPSVTANLNFSGKYIVITTGKRRVGVSSKLKKEQREHYKELFSGITDGDHGVIVRTNAATAEDTVLLAEYEKLLEIWHAVRDGAPHKTCYSLLYQARPAWMEHLMDQREGTVEKVVTDDPFVFDALCAEYRVPDEKRWTAGAVSVPVDSIPVSETLTLSFYRDEAITLSALYGARSSVERALRPQVWLKSGASLIIEHTEALTVIDVNSGKNIAKGDMRAHFLKINLEAAKEIAYQIRLRNISGIILIDFINHLAPEDDDVLLKHFAAYLKEDSVKAEIVDMTKLGLVEVTRKKVRKALREMVG